MSIDLKTDNPNASDIPISSVFYNIWLGRGIVFVSVGLATLLAIAISTYQIGALPRQITYFVDLPSIEKGEYPNSSIFLPQDLKSVSVMTELQQRAREITELNKALTFLQVR